MLQNILEEPLWLQAWMLWMATINTAALVFVARTEARWVLAAWVANIVLMGALFEWNGYNRLLGLSHVLWWTPLIFYLFHRLSRVPDKGVFPAWLKALMLTNSASLLVDYADVVRYALGDRS